MRLLPNQQRAKRHFALLSLPLLVTGTVYGFGLGSPANAATVPTATVPSLSTCAWVLAGVSPTVALTAANPYSGTSDALSGTDVGTAMFVSGDGVQGTACSWYSATPAGATITISVANGPSFTAVPAGLGYTFSAASPLTYAPNSLGAGCPTATGGTSYTSRAMWGAANTGGTTVIYNKVGVNTSSSCTFAPTFSSLIPSGLTAGGLSTVLTGSSVTTTMSLT
jgi:hypothetical protein